LPHQNFAWRGQHLNIDFQTLIQWKASSQDIGISGARSVLRILILCRFLALIMDQPTSEPAQTAPSAQPQPETQEIPTAQSEQTAPSKPVHCLVIDANAIIRNDPTVSSLLAQAEELYTIPAVVSESASSDPHPTTVCLKLF
jgi:hypothetical protein